MRPSLAAASLAVLLTPLAAGAGDGKVVETTTGCLSPDPYKVFEEVYEEQGNGPAYRALLGTEECTTMPSPMQVRLQSVVHSFDYGWGNGDVWRVSPVSEQAPAPETFYIRLRD